jgi:hypothetical protein
MKFILFSPPRHHRSAGIRVVYRLADLIRDVGYEVDQQCNDTYRAKDNEIVIYEDFFGNINPWKAKNIARYLMGFVPEPYAPIPANEYVMVYSKEFMANAQAHYKGKIDESNIFKLPSIEPGLFKPLTKNINSFYVGKGKFISGKVLDGAVEITRTWPNKREEVANILGRSKTFYCFDPFTAMATEAMLCGCEVKYLAPDNVSTSDLINGVMNDKRDLETTREQINRILYFFNLKP